MPARPRKKDPDEQQSPPEATGGAGAAARAGRKPRATGGRARKGAGSAADAPAAASEGEETAARPAARGAKQARTIRCYLCGRVFDVSTKTLSTSCPGCSRAIKVEDVLVKSYLPVNDLQTCGRIKIAKNGRVAARLIQSGGGISCEGAMEGVVETEGEVELGPKASWKGRALHCAQLTIADGAKLDGPVVVPWTRPN